MIYVSHLLPDREMAEVLEQTGAGIESIDFSIAENLDNLKENILDYRGRLRAMGAEHLTIHGPFLDLNPMTFDSRIRQATMLRYAQAYEAAAELGAEKIVYHTCYHPDIYLLTGWAQRTAEFYQEFLENRKGIKVVLENVFDRTWEPMLEAVLLVKSPDFDICLDIGHAHCYSPKPTEDWVNGLKEHISHIHVHDNLGDRDSHMALGQGNIPLEKTLLPLLLENPSATFAIECGEKEAVLKSWKKIRKLKTHTENFLAITNKI